MVANNETPPDSDLLGLEVTAVAALVVLGTLAAFFLVGVVVGIIVLIAGIVLGLLVVRSVIGKSRG
jgi:hypothetical protein